MALINLVINAVHAMAEAGGVLTVGSSREGNEVEITISDEGPGVPEKIRSQMFEPFVTTKPEGKGTGLGLSTVLMVLERHHGRIHYTTEEGRGTAFVVRLPAAPEGQAGTASTR
jgi:signal transduction histidine kinase